MHRKKFEIVKVPGWHKLAKFSRQVVEVNDKKRELWVEKETKDPKKVLFPSRWDAVKAGREWTKDDYVERKDGC